eukprot:11221326-Lingulodinium_polyedra.AAC.1
MPNKRGPEPNNRTAAHTRAPLANSRCPWHSKRGASPVSQPAHRGRSQIGQSSSARRPAALPAPWPAALEPP